MLRRSSLAFVLAAALVVPSAALGAKQRYEGGLGPDSVLAVGFTAVGKKDRKDRLIEKAIRRFIITAQDVKVDCFDPSGRLLSSTRSATWLFPSVGPMRIMKRGSFAGQFSSGTSTTSVTGRLGKGATGSGTLTGTSGQVGVTTYCTTPEYRWGAKAS